MELQLHISKGMPRPYSFSDNLLWNWLITGYSHIAYLKGHLSQYLKSFWLFFMGCYSPALTGNNYMSQFTIVQQQFWWFLVRSLSVESCLQSLPSLACKVQHYSIRPSLLFWKSVYILCTRTARKWNCTEAWLCLCACFHVTIWSS